MPGLRKGSSADDCAFVSSLARSDRVDGGDQYVAVQRLEQIGSGANGLATRAVAGFVVTGDDDGRDADPVSHQMMKQVEAVEFRHLHVDDEALRRAVAKRLQERAC